VVGAVGPRCGGGGAWRCRGAAVRHADGHSARERSSRAVTGRWVLGQGLAVAAHGSRDGAGSGVAGAVAQSQRDSGASESGGAGRGRGKALRAASRSRVWRWQGSELEPPN